MDRSGLMLKGGLLLLLQLASVTKTSATASFRETGIIQVNETEGFVDLILLRGSASGPATFSVQLMTVAEFSMRDLSRAGTCQRSVTESDLDTVGQAQVSDFISRTIEVQFADGEFSQSFRVEIMNDDIAEPSREAAILLVDEDTPNCALPLIIADDDIVRVSFSLREASVTVDSNQTYNNLRVLKTGNNEQDIAFSVTLRSNSAMEGSAFVLVKTMFVFNSTSNNLSLPIQLFDVETAGIRTFTICLPSSFPGTSLLVEAAVPDCFLMSLFYTDEPVIGFVGLGAEPTVTIPEGESSMDICIGIIGGGLGTTNFIELNVTIHASVDQTFGRISITSLFGNLGPNSLLIQLVPGVLSQTCLDVTAVQNAIVDGDATFVVNLAAVGTSQVFSAVLATANLTLTILDDDTNTFTLSTGVGSVVLRESSGGIILPGVTLDRTGSNSNVTFMVTLGTDPPSGSRFRVDPIIIEPGVNTAQVMLSFVNDSMATLFQRFTLSIESVTIEGSSRNIQERVGSVTIDLYDDDIPVGFTEIELTLMEGDTGSFPLRILFPLPNVQPGAEVTVTLAVQREEAGEEVVVALDPTGPITLSPTSPSRTLSITAMDDEVCSDEEKRHTVSFTDASNSGFTAVTGGRDTVTIIVTDDDCESPAVTVVGGSRTSSVCVPCIVVPIVLILLCCPLCILLLLLLLCCCKKKCWHTYNPEKREKKFGGKPIGDDDSFVFKYDKVADNVL